MIQVDNFVARDKTWKLNAQVSMFGDGIDVKMDQGLDYRIISSPTDSPSISDFENERNVPLT